MNASISDPKQYLVLFFNLNFKMTEIKKKSTIQYSDSKTTTPKQLFNSIFHN